MRSQPDRSRSSVLPGSDDDIVLNPRTQYESDRKLAARQQFWAASTREPAFELFPWVLDLAGLGGSSPADVLDVGCGNGAYEAELARRGHAGLVCALDASMGMLRTVEQPARVNADAQRLPFQDCSFDIVLAPHMLYHVPSVETAAREFRRVLRPGGVCVAVTNGEENIREYLDLMEAAVATGWRMERPAEQHFSLENGLAKMSSAFASVERVDCPPSDVVISDLELLAGYVESVDDHYSGEVNVPWSEVVERARAIAAAWAAENGALRWRTAVGAFVCR